ncbi:hypothetical protein [Afifella pfennigii]|uniref:hypothetical protein n=1 Tax=Afifella pfennigii TaxID=209897 RepID=UPI00068FE613|nr:hypothetical protein [Afifella pfennigii]
MAHTESFAAWALLATSILSLGGCSTFGGNSAEPAGPMVRAGGETAPTDLQLLCASEAANRLGIDTTKVLPVSSAPAEPGTYRVALNADGAQAVCLVNESGSVLSVERTG